MKQFVRPAKPGDYAVIFASQRVEGDAAAYAAMADRMVELAAQQPGFIGVETIRGADGFGVTISYWESEQSIRNWKANSEHLEAQRRGQSNWYANFDLRVCRIERAYAGDPGN
jgi:heme-degrading monooxygenase HmoA